MKYFHQQLAHQQKKKIACVSLEKKACASLKFFLILSHITTIIIEIQIELIFFSFKFLLSSIMIKDDDANDVHFIACLL